ncbi:hypothetical protein HG530_011932 [Fusarium avenaceum]|nr:hypothetical protein HG530_011932 [Fusarium avenaceum]
MHTSAIFSTETLSCSGTGLLSSTLTVLGSRNHGVGFTDELVKSILNGQGLVGNKVAASLTNDDLLNTFRLLAQEDQFPICGTTSSRKSFSTSIKQDLPITSLLSNLLFGNRSRSDVEFDTRSNLGLLVLLSSLAEDTGSSGNIRGSGVGAGNEISLVDGNVLGLEVLQGSSDLDRVGAGNNW